jgi:hypothetical protein
MRERWRISKSSGPSADICLNDQHKVGKAIVQELERLHKRNHRYNVSSVVLFALAAIVFWTLLESM